MVTGHVVGSVGSVALLVLFLYGFLYYSRTGEHLDLDAVRDHVDRRDPRLLLLATGTTVFLALTALAAI